MKLSPKHIFLILSALFLVYSFSIYLKPLSVKEDSRFNAEIAAKGKLVWQNYNCQSCHQLFGLGGYLGPDLSNVISTPNKGEALVRAMIASGTRQMPAFKLTETEITELIEFLKSADASGKSSPENFQKNSFGMIEAK